MKKILFVLLVLVCACAAQTNVPIEIPKGAKVQLMWTAPPDTDVVSYRIYSYLNAQFVSMTPVTSWNVVNGTTTNNVIADIPLGIGEGHFNMTAVDRGGNESVHSNDALFRIIDPRPGAPLIIELRVL
jgi:hypothetical protein